MMGEQVNPGDSTDFVVPTIGPLGTAAAVGTIYDYMAIPTDVASIVFSALPLRCYNHIYNNWFRNQNIIASVVVNTDDGPDSKADYTLLKRQKRPDYFVSCLPFPQKGPDVTVNLGGNARVATDLQPTGADLSIYSEFNSDYIKMGADGTFVGANDVAGTEASQLYADLENATGITINALRQSVQIQRLFERDARSGTRYPEVLKAHFGVTDPSMLVHQRPLFLGGGHSAINISPVQQTQASPTSTGDAEQTAQGNLAGFGTVTGNGHGFTQSFTEHGVIIGIVNVRSDITYQQGLERFWSRQTRFDFFWPVLSHLGEVPVLQQEILILGDDTKDPLVFGYNEIYADYRYIPSKITGLFRSSAANSLDVWHLAQDFGVNPPTLSQSFIESGVPIDRVVAVPSEPDFLLDVYFNIRAARPLPLYGTPGMMDHF